MPTILDELARLRTAPMESIYLIASDDESRVVTWGELATANADHAELLADLANLEIGQIIGLGGGAEPAIAVVRLAPTLCAILGALIDCANRAQLRPSPAEPGRLPALAVDVNARLAEFHAATVRR